MESPVNKMIADRYCLYPNGQSVECPSCGQTDWEARDVRDAYNPDGMEARLYFTTSCCGKRLLRSIGFVPGKGWIARTLEEVDR